jgi:DNA mismatch repair ATPase MutS
VRSRSHEPGLAAVFLRATEGASGPVFDYVLQDGVSDQRLGMALLQREGVTSALVAAIHRRQQVPLA